MSIIPAAALSSSDLRNLGNNVGPTIRQDQEHLAAVNRSLYLHQEHTDRLYRRSGHARLNRLRAKV